MEDKSKWLRSHLIPFKQNRLLQITIAVFSVFWIIMAIRPSDWKIWAVENSLLVAFVIVLIVVYRKFPHSNLSYVLIAIFLAMHAYAAHYTYQDTPIDDWLKQIFHIKRGFYDRIVHFAFGLLIAFPVREAVQYFLKLHKKWPAYIVTFTMIMTASALYELLEMWSAYLFNKKMAAKYIGLEGDVFDSQKDMTSALGGVLIAIVIFLILHNTLNRRNNTIGKNTD
ncbi:DUF2238 domain-containing protein [Paenibacillus sp. JDR-2]|uniref:DUF2238 domain-containing protein n=1 Tax=Paenibacillus sp. (strain JDR-2) TaxID=324057 RepID=UPI0001663EA5|nr:DUF2238 domain-containing protein [Paenibacillus sp. JDR-2]ACT02717.1 putative integral membrane protein [Paenibacillus sp. JDR-2]